MPAPGDSPCIDDGFVNNVWFIMHVFIMSISLSGAKPVHTSLNISQRLFDEAFMKRLRGNDPAIEELLEEFVDTLQRRDGAKEKWSRNDTVISAFERSRPGNEFFPLTKPK